MEITITKDALEVLKKRIGDTEGFLKIRYDTEGCGCAVSGIPVLEYVEKKGDGDIEITTDSMPVLVEKSKQVFYDNIMKIDFSSSSNTFQLKSPAQILNGRMNFFIR
jgi:uncharacterized protein YqkB